MTEQEWLNQLKIGDEVVILASGALGTADSISTIVRMTATLFITESGRKFSKSHGRSPGGGYYHASLTQPTQERLDEIKRTLLAVRLNRVDWKTLSLETLMAVWELSKKST